MAGYLHMLGRRPRPGGLELGARGVISTLYQEVTWQHNSTLGLNQMGSGAGRRYCERNPKSVVGMTGREICVGTREALNWGQGVLSGPYIRGRRKKNPMNL